MRMSELVSAEVLAEMRADRQFRMKVYEPGFVAREVVPVGTLYDPQFVYGRESDGSILLGDVGGHVGSYSTDKPHGQYLKLNPDDDSVSFVMPPENAPAAPICSIRAPDSFGPGAGTSLPRRRSSRAGLARATGTSCTSSRPAPTATKSFANTRSTGR